LSFGYLHGGLDLMTRWPHLYGLAAVAALGLTCSGCSLLFTKKAPSSTENLPVTAPVKCTSSVVAPVVDSIVGTLQVVRTGMAISADESDYGANPTITREMDIGIGATLATLFVTSAVYGFVVTNDCRTFKARQAGFPRDGDEPRKERYDLPPLPVDSDRTDLPPGASAPPPTGDPSARKAASPATP
jgi:hypothetical protein